jgi:maltooligosyltrehalose synthase
MRVSRDAASLTVVPRLPHALLAGSDAIVIPADSWQDTALRFPVDLAGRRLHNAFAGPAITLAPTIRVGELLPDCPVSLHCAVESA